MKIMFVGWFIPNRNGDGIVRAFERIGHTVYKVSMDAQIPSLLSHHDLHVKTHFGAPKFSRMLSRELRVPLYEIMKKYCPDVDLVYIYQTSVPISTHFIPVPVVYYHHEIGLPCIPDGRIDLILYNYFGCKEQLDKIYKDRLVHVPFVQATYGMEVDRYQFWQCDRPLFMGFKGALHFVNPDNDPVMEGIYLQRRRFVQYAKDHLDCYFENFTINVREMEQLLYFLNHCNLSLNIPGAIGEWGFNNERMNLAMAVGCVLVQYRFPHMADLGLIDYENCLVFGNEQELTEKVEWAKTHPKELNEIRSRAYHMVRTRYNHLTQAEEQLASIKKYLFKRMESKMNQPIQYKTIAHTTRCCDVGLITMRNEAEDVRGWAKTMLYFCKKVYAIIDPDTIDSTADILKSEFPSVNILWQDRSLGDSDDGKKGPKEHMICHANLQLQVNRLVKKNQWFLILAPDERFNPHDFKMIEHEVEYAKKTGCDGVWFPNFLNFYPDEQHCFDWVQHYPNLRQVKFYKKIDKWEKNLEPHSGYGSGQPQIQHKTTMPFYHYNFVKDTRTPFGLWRDQQQLQDFETFECPNPIPRWRDLSSVDLHGNLLIAVNEDIPHPTWIHRIKAHYQNRKMKRLCAWDKWLNRFWYMKLKREDNLPWSPLRSYVKKQRAKENLK